MKLKAIIVEDEVLTRELLLQRITEWQPDVTIMDACADAKDAILSFAKHKPDIIFLDICMPGMNGLEFFGILQELNIPVQCIIISGYAEKEYFQEAIRLGVIDYLLKPVKKEELNDAVKNVVHRIASGKHHDNIRELNAALQQQKINLPVFGGAVSLHADKILYAISNAKYADLHLTDHSKETIYKSISELETILQPFHIIRIDRFTLMNPKYVHKVLLKSNKTYMQSENKMLEIIVSKTGAEKVFELMKLGNT